MKVMEIQINRKFDNRRRNGKTDSSVMFIIEELKKQRKLINQDVYGGFTNKIILK